MPTDYNIIWSDRADRDIDVTITYLEKHWDEATAHEFLVDLLERAYLISKHPKAFRKSDKMPPARRSVLSKQTIIYYQVDVRNKAVEIISVSDARQDPSKLHF